MGMAEKTIAEKLLIKPGTSVWVSDDSRRALLGVMPPSVTTVDGPDTASTAVLFVDDAATVRALFSAHHEHLLASTNVWVLYPKGNKADINRDSLWPIVAEYGLRPITQVSVHETWSALRFRPLREGETPFTGGR
jgi:hypothetical protein